MSEVRRRMMMAIKKGGGESANYELMDNTKYDPTNGFSYEELYICLLCKIENSLVIHVELDGLIEPGPGGKLYELDENKAYIDYWGIDTSRTITLTGGNRTKYVVCSIDAFSRKEQLVKDITNDKILFKGTMPVIIFPNRIIDKSTTRVYRNYILPSESESEKCVYLFPVTNSQKVTWGTTSKKGMSILREADELYQEVDYWNPQSNPRTISIDSVKTKFLATSFSNEDFDYGYIYDETNKVYIYKGKNVQ